MHTEDDQYKCIEDEEGQYVSFWFDEESEDEYGGVHLEYHWVAGEDRGTDYLFLSDEEMEQLVYEYQKYKRDL